LVGTCPACQAGLPRHAGGVLTHLPDTRERLRRKLDVGFAKLAALQPNKPIPNPTSKGRHSKNKTPQAPQKARGTITLIRQYRICLSRGNTWADGFGTRGGFITTGLSLPAIPPHSTPVSLPPPFHSVNCTPWL